MPKCRISTLSDPLLFPPYSWVRPNGKKNMMHVKFFFTLVLKLFSKEEEISTKDSRLNLFVRYINYHVMVYGKIFTII
jgi:hypothetical protein